HNKRKNDPRLNRGNTGIKITTRAKPLDKELLTKATVLGNKLKKFTEQQAIDIINSLSKVLSRTCNPRSRKRKFIVSVVVSKNVTRGRNMGKSSEGEKISELNEQSVKNHLYQDSKWAQYIGRRNMARAKLNPNF
ncbi:hypothetical protein WA026_021988, partial [Henosepilachna vigintioctopunctata]